MDRKLSYGDEKALFSLAKGESVRGTAITGRTARALCDAALVSAVREGRSIIYTAPVPSLVGAYFASLVGTDDLVRYMELRRRTVEEGYEPTRSESAKATNDSKAFGTDVMKGIRLNSLRALTVSYGGAEMTIDPPLGTCLEVDDEKRLEIGGDVAVVCVENYHTFMRIKEYAHLFSADVRYLFTYRDTTSGGKTYSHLERWLGRVPNRFIYFGDLDKGGLRIYVDSFRRKFGERAEFLLPEGFEAMIREGSSRLYDDQYAMAYPDAGVDPRIQPLIRAIERYHRCVEQEKLSAKAFIR